MLRTDRAPFMGALSPVVRRSDGSVLFSGIAIREGVLEYPNPDGTVRRELVTESAVLDTARTLARAPVTLGHPDSEDGLVHPENAGRYVVGDVDGTTEYGTDELGGFAHVKIAVRRADALKAIDDGTGELSVGYLVTEYDPTPGVHPLHGAYDGRQVHRDANHLAIVPDGRRGPLAALKLDSATLSTEPRFMNPKLVHLLTLLGVPAARLDSEEGAVAMATEKARELLAASEAEPAADADDVDALKAENAALKEQLAGMMEAAAVADLAPVAEAAGVKMDSKATAAALKLAIAQTVIPGARADWGTRLDGIVDVVRVQAKPKQAAQPRFAAPTDYNVPAGRADAAAIVPNFSIPSVDGAKGGAK